MWRSYIHGVLAAVLFFAAGAILTQAIMLNISWWNILVASLIATINVAVGAMQLKLFADSIREEVT